MTFRSRPVLDRRHRPRWQDELRTQQLTVMGFALAIALALGIFGAAAWNGYWESHFRPVAAVAGAMYDRSDLSERERIITAETISTVRELQAQLTGGPRDQLLQQQIDSLSMQFNSLETTASESLVDSAVLAARADDYGVTVSDEAVDAEVAERMQLPERVHARLILVNALPDDAEPDAEPTEEQRASARAEAEEARDRIDSGESFTDVAAEVSDDFTATNGGDLGWFEAGDATYAEYFEALADAEVGDVVGPVETEEGYALLELVERREASAGGDLRELLREQGVTDEAYREYVRGELLMEAFREHFTTEVVTSSGPQRRVAQILIAPLTGEAVPQERARHVLVQPLPEAEDQAEASDEEWEAAREEADQVRDDLLAEGADWYAIAEEHSDDTGSASRGGDLGWYDPEASPFVAEFNEALAELEVGEISEPVRTDFGWHVIQKTGERENPEELAARLVDELDGDVERFADAARRLSDDHATAREGGELGWVVRWQLDRMNEDAVFELREPGDVSEPIETADGITIYQLLETSASQEIEEDRLEQIGQEGFERWLTEEVRAPVETWVDPQFATTSAA